MTTRTAIKVALAGTLITAGMLIIYAGFALRYYYTQVHPFDPFTQMPLVRLSEPIPSKQPNELRVLALGGSTTASVDLPDSDRYPAVAEQRLSRAYPGLRVHVLNTGRDWSTARHNLIEYVSYYQDWKPDLVLILAGINDLYRSFAPAQYAIGEYDSLYSHFYGAASDAALPPSFEQHLYRKWFGPIVTTYWYEAPFVRKKTVDYPVETYRSIPAFEAHLTKLVAAVRANGAMPVLVTQATLYKDALTADEQKVLWFGEVFCATRTGFARYSYPTTSSLRRAMDALNDRTRAVAAREQVPLVDGAQVLAKTLDVLQDDCHYTSEGAHRLGVAAAQRIIDLNLVGSRRKS